MAQAPNSAKAKNLAQIKMLVKEASEEDKKKKKVFVVIAAVVFLIVLAAVFLYVFTPEPTPVTNPCSNGLLDELEEGIDCGGICSELCPVEEVDKFLVQPVSVSDAAANPAANRLYILDESRHRVMIYDLEFNHIKNVGETVTEEGYFSGGREPGKLLFPAALDLDEDGKLYVIDRELRIQVFSKEGEFIKEMDFESNIRETLPKLEDTPHIDGAGVSIEVAPGGNIYVSDELSSVVALFSPELKLTKSVGGRGAGNEQLIFPGQVTFYDGKVYVPDSGNSRVQVFDAELNYLSSITEELTQPTAVAVNSSGELHVLDPWDNKLKVFDSAGSFVRETGGLGVGLGEFYGVTKIRFDAEDKLYVAEMGNVRLQILNKELVPINSISGILGGNLTGFSPFYAAVSPTGQIAVSESLNHRINVFESDGTLVRTMGIRGFGDSEFNIPKGLAFDAQGNLFVNDSWNHRILVFSKDYEYVKSIKHQELFWPVALAVGPDGTIYVGEDTSKKVLMFDSDGEFLGSIYEEKGITLPLGVLATSDRVFITDDKEKTIEVFDAELNKLESIGDIDNRVGLHVEFNESFALDSSGNLLFCDNRNRKVIAYNFATEEFSYFGDFGGFPDELSVLEVAASSDGELIAVTDLVMHKLFLFNSDYEQIQEIGIENLIG